MNVRFPPAAGSPAKRLRHCARLRERLRRRNNWYVARADAAEALRFHREWFLPRNRAITAVALRLRARVFPGWRPAGENDTPPWVPERVRIRRLRDNDNELEGIKLAEAFEGKAATAELPDPTEDYTTYTEVDAASLLTVTASNIAFADVRRDAVAQVYDDKGASHFGATFEHNVDGRLTMDNDGYAEIWTLTNLIDGSFDLWANQDEALFLRMTGYGNRAYLFACNGQSSDLSIIAFPLNTWKYLTVERTGETALECRIYSNAARTTLDDTMYVTVVTGERYRYVMGFNTPGPGVAGPSASISGDVANLDLQEAAAAFVPYPYPLHELTGGLSE